jgi:catechol-2,3-dioxygenase
MNPASTPPALEAVDHIHIHVSDRASAERWYREVLGFTRVPELERWTADQGPLTLRNAGDTIHLALFERPKQPSRTTIALRVTAPDFLAWRAHLSQALGQPVLPVDHEVSWSLYFVDPDGNPYEITSYAYEDLRSRLRA